MPAAGDEEMLEAKSLEAPFSFKTDAIFHYWQEEKAGDEGPRSLKSVLVLPPQKAKTSKIT